MGVAGAETGILLSSKHLIIGSTLIIELIVELAAARFSDQKPATCHNRGKSG